jgi:hypothetical protein
MGISLRDKILVHTLSPDLSFPRCDGIVFAAKGLNGAWAGRDSFSSTMSLCEQGLEESPARRSGIWGRVAVRSCSPDFQSHSQQLVHNRNWADM